jgi:hypothetical protein
MGASSQSEDALLYSEVVSEIFIIIFVEGSVKTTINENFMELIQEISFIFYLKMFLGVPPPALRHPT